VADPMTRDAMIEKLDDARPNTCGEYVRRSGYKSGAADEDCATCERSPQAHRDDVAIREVIAALRAAPPADAPDGLTRYRLRCASCGQSFDSVRLYTGGGKDWLHDADEEGSAACGPVVVDCVAAPPADTLDGPRATTALDREYAKALDVINRQREEIERLKAAPPADAGAPPALVALDDIAMSARRGLAFGHQATPQTPERMIERKEQALSRILDICERHGVTSSVLRGTPAPPAAPPAEALREMQHAPRADCDAEGWHLCAPAAPPAEETDVQAIAAVAWECIKHCKGYDMPPVMCPAHQEQAKRLAAPPADARRDCTCLGTCRGPDGLGERWKCALGKSAAPPAVQVGEPMPAVQVGDVVISKLGNRWTVTAVDGRLLLLHNVPPEAPDARGTTASGPMPEWAAAVERNGQPLIWRRREGA